MKKLNHIVSTEKLKILSIIELKFFNKNSIKITQI